MTPAESQPTPAANSQREPAPAHYGQPHETGGPTGPYWDALRQLPRVRVGGNIGAGLVFSSRPRAEFHPHPSFRE